MTIAICIGTVPTPESPQRKQQHVVWHFAKEEERQSQCLCTVDELSAVSEFSAKIQMHLLCAWLDQGESPDLLVHECILKRRRLGCTRGIACC